MKKCTLCIDRIYNETMDERDRVPACVAACPVGARHFGDLGDEDSPVSQLVAERGGYGLMPELGYAPVNQYLPPRPSQARAGCTGGGGFAGRRRGAGFRILALGRSAAVAVIRMRMESSTPSPQPSPARGEGDSAPRSARRLFRPSAATASNNPLSPADEVGLCRRGGRGRGEGVDGSI